MPNIFHIVNGDSTLAVLQETPLDGDSLVWREMLVEGPLEEAIHKASFWLNRQTYYREHLKVSEEDYTQKVIREIEKISALKTGEIVAWFEYDLFCQINLLGLCALLYQHFNSSCTYQLICTGHLEGYKGLTALGHIKPEDYPSLFDQRTSLTYEDLSFAHTCWVHFVKGNYKALAQQPEHPKFPYLPGAIAQWRKTIPDQNGLNQIDKKLIEIIGKGADNFRQIIRAVFAWQEEKTVYGYGDFQYELALNRLSKYICKSDDTYTLTAIGKKIFHDS